jgi:hypothetical protein
MGLVVMGIVVMVMMMMEPMRNTRSRDIAYRASADGPDRSANNGAGAGAHQSIVKSLPRHRGATSKRDTDKKRCNKKGVCHLYIPLVWRTIKHYRPNYRRTLKHCDENFAPKLIASAKLFSICGV